MKLKKKIITRTRSSVIIYLEVIEMVEKNLQSHTALVVFGAKPLMYRYNALSGSGRPSDTPLPNAVASDFHPGF